MIQDLEIGTKLFCKYRGWGKVISISENGFKFECEKDPEDMDDKITFHKNDDLEKVILYFDPNAKEITTKEVVLKVINFEDCAVSEEALESEDYKEECIYLSGTINYLNKLIYKNLMRVEKLRDEFTYSPSLSEMDMTSGERQAMGRAQYENNEYEEIAKEPYFGMVEIKAKESGEIIRTYIGHKNLVDGATAYVEDWRNPIAQRYYNTNELEYMVGEEIFNTNLIRDYVIEDSIMQEVVDKYIRTGDGTANIVSDAFLLKILKSKRNAKDITDIISSIQVKQNEIIIQDKSENMIVQGCAGSGKTMILFHRISRLVYNNREMDKSRIKIITPNDLFIKVMGNLSNQLELDEIEKLCLEDYMFDKIEDYGLVLDEDERENISYMRMPDDMYEYVYSDEYLAELEDGYRKYVETLWKRAESRGITEVAEKLEISYSRKDSPREDYSELEHLLGLIKAKNSGTFTVNKEVSDLKIGDFKLDDIEFLRNRVYEDIRAKVCRKFDFKPGVRTLRIDLYSILYLLYMHKGKVRTGDRMLLIDEGQNISPQEYRMLKRLNREDMVFNILGDINQLTDLKRGTDDWSKIQDICDFTMYELNENYRNTKKITEYCHEQTGYEMIPIGVDDGNVIVGTEDDIEDIIDTYKKDNSKRKAVIISGSPKDNLRKLFDNFSYSDEINIVDDYNSFPVANKINVYTVDMVKGLEFDSVLVITENMNKNQKYIAYTRALLNCYIVES